MMIENGKMQLMWLVNLESIDSELFIRFFHTGQIGMFGVILYYEQRQPRSSGKAS